MKKQDTNCLFASFARIDDLLACIANLRRMEGVTFTILSPVPHHEIVEALPRAASPIRVFTLMGGLTGLTCGWLVTLGPLHNFSIYVGGKPLESLPPFGVVAYIFTILFGALATLAGFIINGLARAPRIKEGYDPRVSSDHFGIQICSSQERLAGIHEILTGCGAMTVTGMNPQVGEQK